MEQPTREGNTNAEVVSLANAAHPVVLIIEDEKDVSQLLGRILRNDYLVHCAGDGREGLEKALAVPPDLILCDLMMDGMSGTDFVRAARAMPQLHTVPIVVLTALHDASLRAEILRAGAQDYLTKPFEIEELLARVAHHIAVSRARRALRAEILPAIAGEAGQHAAPSHDLAELAAQVTAQKRTLENTLESLRRSRALYHALARDFVHAAGVFFDEDLRFTAVQGEGFAVYGVGEAEIVGKTVREAFAPFVADVLEPHFRAALSGIATTFELPDDRRVDGPLSLVRALPVHDEDSHVVGGLAVIQTVQEHQLEEDEWQSFQARILSQVEDAVNVIDAQHRVLYWNHASERLYGVAAEDVLGRGLSEIYDYEWVGVERAAVLECLQRDGWWKGECLHRLHSDGREISVEVSLSLLREPAGASAGFLAVIRDITARKRALQTRTQLEKERDELLTRLQIENEETRRLKERLHLQIERMPIACILWDSDFRVVSWNPAATTIFGYEADEVLGRHAFSLIVTSEIQEQVQEVWQRLIAGDVTANSVNANVTRDGSTIFCQWSNTPLFEDNGSVSGVLSMVQDITARVEAENALRRSEERFRLTFEEAAVGVANIAPGGRWLRVNRKLCEILGYTREELLAGLSFQELTHPADLQHNLELFEEALNGQTSSYSLEKRYIHKSGQAVWCSVTMSVIRDNQDNEPYLIAVVADITTRKQAENTQHILSEASAALSASLNYETTVETLGNLCTPTIAELCVIDLIYAAESETSPTQSSWRRVLTRQGDEGPTPFTAALAQSLQFPGSVADEVRLDSRICIIREIEAANIAANAEHQSVLEGLVGHSMIVAPLVARGGVIGIVTLINSPKRPAFSQSDSYLVEELMRRAALALENAHLYSEAEKARREAEAANRAKDEFLAVVSHELRTPLTPILGWVSMLRDEGMLGVIDDETRGHALSTIQRNAELQAQLIDDLLDVSRIISGNVRLHKQAMRLRTIVEAALDVPRVQAREKDIALWTSFDPTLGFVEGDGRRLQQVVANLLSNAIKFTPSGGRVEVQLTAKEDFAELMVRDSGIGIAPQFLPQVFERFSQADSSTSRTFGGLGLGLAIARHIVELHDGSIRALSDGEGQGATFIVRLPVPAREEPRFIESALDPVRPRSLEDSHRVASLFKAAVLAGKRVLVVDDELSTRDMLAEVLRHGGAEVESAESAAGAREVLTRWRPDALVCDIGMPGEDGYGFMRFLRALHPDDGGALPSIALTAYARAEDCERALAAGFDRHVAKPVAPADLILAVAEITAAK